MECGVECGVWSVLYLRQFVSRLVHSGLVFALWFVHLSSSTQLKFMLVVSFSGPSADACAEVDLADLCRCDPAPRLLHQSGFSEFTWTLRAAAASRGRPGDELSLSV